MRLCLSLCYFSESLSLCDWILTDMSTDSTSTDHPLSDVYGSMSSMERITPMHGSMLRSRVYRRIRLGCIRTRISRG